VEKLSFFVSAMIIGEMLLISILYLQNFLIKHTLFSLPESLKSVPDKIKSAMARSFLDNLCLILLVTLLVKGVLMLLPWRF
jgi:hypothetical protein